MSKIGGIDLGGLTDYLFFFADGAVNANWEGHTNGYLGNVAIDGLTANENTRQAIAYAGTISTNESALGGWQHIVDQNPTQSNASVNQNPLILGLKVDLVNAIQQINVLPASLGFESVDSSSLDGLNTLNGIDEVFVINITSGFEFNKKINITGDAGDVYILRWDEDANPVNGYQGTLRPHAGGAIVPHGGLMPSNFISVAGNINAEGGGSTPAFPYPQGPRYYDSSSNLIIGGSDWTGGGFFTGYLLTTGAPTTLNPSTGLYTGETLRLSDAIFVGGWYSLTTSFSMSEGTSGIHVAPNPATFANPKVDIKKYVSPDNGFTWDDAQDPPGPTIFSNIIPQFMFVVTNTGNVTLTNIDVQDSVYGAIGTLDSLDPGTSTSWTIQQPWSEGEHENIATVTAQYNTDIVTSLDAAHYCGVQLQNPAIQLVKYVSSDGGATWQEAHTPPGPDITSNIAPMFQFVVTNIGNTDLANVNIVDDVYGPIGSTPLLSAGASAIFLYTATWQEGQHENTATATGDFGWGGVSSQSSSYYNGVPAKPAMSFIKYISIDNGVTWLEAHTPPGPDITPDITPQFKFSVINTGNVDLYNVNITDDIFGPIGGAPFLSVGGSIDYYYTAPWQEGQHTNTATATADFIVDPISEQSSANYNGIVIAPGVSITKYVSPDNGATWVEAPNAPGPDITSNITPQFKFVVTNTGNEDLFDVTITDDVYGPLGSVTPLPVGESAVFTFTEPWELGQHTNTATVNASYDGGSVSDQSTANYNGVEAEPGISIVKYVSVDNGVTWLDANTSPGPMLPAGNTAQFKYVVTNTGNVDLFDILVTDDVLGTIGGVPTLAAGASQTFFNS